MALPRNAPAAIPRRRRPARDQTGSMAISHVSVLMIPVGDQERALAFYRDALGFPVHDDRVVGPGMRWVHLKTPTPGLDLALADWLDVPAGSVRGLVLQVDDVESTAAELEARGVRFTDDVEETAFGRFRTFADPDGNELVLHEPPR